MRQLGAHVSAAGGIDKAVERVAAIGGNCLQLFSGSPRVWAKPGLEKYPLDKFFSNREKYAISPVFTHALYLVNLASDKPENIRKSFDSLKYELEFDSLVKGSGVVVHLGSHQGRGWEASKEQLAKHIDALLKVTPDDSTFLIENSAGQKGKIASDLHEVRWLLDQAELSGKWSKNRFGWCFDTCHGHAAGYRLADPAKIPASEKSAYATITDLDLWSTLRVVHVNDSRDPFASGRDRHANIGEGNIPKADLQFFINTPEVQKLPLILEVPGLDGNGPDGENIGRVQQLVAC
ncbi:MAG: deoxyribonuclease IV [bacterium]|nr:deoxyribonuclease IV [bacterium]